VGIGYLIHSFFYDNSQSVGLYPPIFNNYNLILNHLVWESLFRVNMFQYYCNSYNYRFDVVSYKFNKIVLDRYLSFMKSEMVDFINLNSGFVNPARFNLLASQYSVLMFETDIYFNKISFLLNQNWFHLNYPGNNYDIIFDNTPTIHNVVESPYLPNSFNTNYRCMVRPEGLINPFSI
jgi:hypothetical protein